MHLLKAGGRTVVNATTAGLGAPVLSTAEDVLAVGLSLAALLLPVLVLLLLVLLVVGLVLGSRRSLPAAPRTSRVLAGTARSPADPLRPVPALVSIAAHCSANAAWPA